MSEINWPALVFILTPIVLFWLLVLSVIARIGALMVAALWVLVTEKWKWL